MTSTTGTRQYIITIQWDEMTGFHNGRPVLSTETERVTITAASAAAALTAGRAMAAEWDEGAYLREVTPA